MAPKKLTVVYALDDLCAILSTVMPCTQDATSAADPLLVL